MTLDNKNHLFPAPIETTTQVLKINSKGARSISEALSEDNWVFMENLIDDDSFSDYSVSPEEKGYILKLDRVSAISSVQKENNTSWMESWELDAVIKAFEKVKGTSFTEEEVSHFSYELRKSANIDIDMPSVDKLTGKKAVAEIEKAAIIMRDTLTPKLKKAKKSSDFDQIKYYEKEIYELQKDVLVKVGIQYTFDESRLTHLEYAELFKELENFGLRQTHLKHFIPKYFYSLKSYVARKLPNTKLSKLIAPAPAGISLF